MLSDIESMGFDDNSIQLDINQENELEKRVNPDIFLNFVITKRF